MRAAWRCAAAVVKSKETSASALSGMPSSRQPRVVPAMYIGAIVQGLQTQLPISKAARLSLNAKPMARDSTV